VFRYEDLVEDDSSLIAWCRSIGLHPLANDFRFHRDSLRKWERNSRFLYNLSPETIELAERFGYSRESLQNPRTKSLTWLLNEWTHDVWFTLRKTTRINRLIRLRS
jgi:hypothetical protein